MDFGNMTHSEACAEYFNKLLAVGPEPITDLVAVFFSLLRHVFLRPSRP